MQYVVLVTIFSTVLFEKFIVFCFREFENYCIKFGVLVEIYILLYLKHKYGII